MFEVLFRYLKRLFESYTPQSSIFLWAPPFCFTFIDTSPMHIVMMLSMSSHSTFHRASDISRYLIDFPYMGVTLQ